MTPCEFFDSCFADAMMMLGGYEERSNDEWRRTRFLVYMHYCSVTEVKDREEIYDFLPISDDPNKEERALLKRQWKKKKQEDKAGRAKEMYERHKQLWNQLDKRENKK